MMNKPKKKKEKGYLTTNPKWHEDKGYNQAHDELTEYYEGEIQYKEKAAKRAVNKCRELQQQLKDSAEIREIACENSILKTDENIKLKTQLDSLPSEEELEDIITSNKLTTQQKTKAIHERITNAT